MKGSRYSSSRLDANGLLPSDQKNFIINVDDCICNRSTRNPLSRMTTAEAIQAKEVPGAREWVNALVESGHHVCFFSSRPKKLKSVTRKWLESHGFKFEVLLMGKPEALKYHYIDDRHVQATTFEGRFSTLVKKDKVIHVFG